jgi:ribulose-phosphate 3-epimerase
MKNSEKNPAANSDSSTASRGKKTPHPWIAPSLLAADLTNLRTEIGKVEAAGADVLHVDVMDGHFVPNLTFGLPVIAAIKKHTQLPIDAHLMITNADTYIDAYAKAGCNWLSVHVEACPHLHRTLQQIRFHGMRAGVAINPGTALTALDAVLDHVDFVLVMTVNPGFGGQGFIQGSWERVKQLRKNIGNRPVQIEVDGGIKMSNAAEAVDAGCDILVVGTGLFGEKDYLHTVKKLRGEHG